MRFEWDDAKARANLRKHGIDFADAATVFDDESALTIPDTGFDEDRYVTMAVDAPGRILVVVYTRLLQKPKDPLLPRSHREQVPSKSVIPCHPRESGEKAGIHSAPPVIPCHPRESGEQAGIHINHESLWIPASAGMTKEGGTPARAGRCSSTTCSAAGGRRTWTSTSCCGGEDKAGGHQAYLAPAVKAEAAATRRTPVRRSALRSRSRRRSRLRSPP